MFADTLISRVHCISVHWALDMQFLAVVTKLVDVPAVAICDFIDVVKLLFAALALLCKLLKGML